MLNTLPDTFDCDTSGGNLRVSETTGTDTTTYLFDTTNHSGYAKPIEEYVNGSLDKTYTHGHQIISQTDATHGTLTFLQDGHGSTRALVDGAGQLVIAAQDASSGNVTTLHYSAFGDAINFNAATAITSWQAPDGSYSGVTTLTYHLKRYRDGWRFMTLDSFAGNNADPVSLHKYLYAHANPIMGIDPSGRSLLGLIVGNTIRQQLIGLAGLTAVNAWLWGSYVINTFWVGDSLTPAQQGNVTKAIDFIRSVEGYSGWADRAAQMTYKINPNEHWGQTRRSFRTVWLSEKALQLDYRFLASMVLHENVHVNQLISVLRGAKSWEKEAYQVESSFMHKANLSGTIDDVLTIIGSQSPTDIFWLRDQADAFAQLNVPNPAVRR